MYCMELGHVCGHVWLWDDMMYGMTCEIKTDREEGVVCGNKYNSMQSYIALGECTDTYMCA